MRPSTSGAAPAVTVPTPHCFSPLEGGASRMAARVSVPREVVAEIAMTEAAPCGRGLRQAPVTA